VHRWENSNELDSSVHLKQKSLQRLFKIVTVPANNRIPKAVQQGIPERWTNHRESQSATGAEPVARYYQEQSGGGLDTLL